MRGRWARRFVALGVLVLACGVLTPHLVLCLGEDGHRAVESALADCCVSAPRASDAGLTECADACVDTPVRLWADVSPHATPRSAAAGHGPLMPARTAPPAVLAPASVGQARIGPDDTGARPDARRSPVLRC